MTTEDTQNLAFNAKWTAPRPHLVFWDDFEPKTKKEKMYLYNALKTHITQDTVTCSEKFKTSKQVRNFKNHVFLTNDEEAVSIQSDDRRFFIAKMQFKNSEDAFKKMKSLTQEEWSAFIRECFEGIDGIDLNTISIPSFNNFHEYFEYLYRLSESEYLPYIYKYFLSINITGLEKISQAPITGVKKAIIENTGGLSKEIEDFIEETPDTSLYGKLIVAVSALEEDFFQKKKEEEDNFTEMKSGIRNIYLHL